MKPIYYFDLKTKNFIGSDLLLDSNVLPINATYVPPDDGLNDPVVWNGDKWI